MVLFRRIKDYRYSLLAFTAISFLFLVLAYPRISSEQTFYLKGLSQQSFGGGSETSVSYKFSDLFGFRTFEVLIPARHTLESELDVSEISESGIIHSTHEYRMSDSGVEKNGKLLAAYLEGDSFLYSNTDSAYSLIRTERVPIPLHIFEHENIQLQSPPDSNNSFQGHLNASKRISGSLRLIEYYAFLAEDFSSNETQDNLISEVLSATLFANLYLEPLGFKLVVKGIRIFRQNSPFTEALSQGDPRQMLNAVMDQHRLLEANSRQLSIVFSKTHFSKASGLSYVSSSCLFPDYSVAFVTQGGESLTNKIIFPSTIAHEVGHFLGMNHDEGSYDHGTSLMASKMSLLPFGYSDTSIIEQRNHSAEGSPGGACFRYDESITDTDGDRVSDAKEISVGTNPVDAGSKPELPESKLFTSWNGFKNQVSIGEVVSASTLYSKVDVDIFDIDGNPIVEKEGILPALEQRDIIFNELTSSFTDSYGLVRLSSLTPLTGRSNVYSHTGYYSSFNFITPQAFFTPVTSNKASVMSFNTLLPSGFGEGSAVYNWLSLANLSDKEARFIVQGFDSTGNQLSNRIVVIPSYGRRDILATEDQTSFPYGMLKVFPESSHSEVPYFSFVSRYYVNSNGSLTGASIVDGKVPSGAPRYFVVDNREVTGSSIQSDSWLEISNARDQTTFTEVTFLSEREPVQGLNSQYNLLPYSQVHVPMPTKGLHLVKVEGHQKESLSASAFKYQGARDYSSVTLLPLAEALFGEVSGSTNSFLNTTTEIYVGNPEKKNAVLSCAIRQETHSMKITRDIGDSPIKVFSMKDLFPTFPTNAYAHLRCKLYTQEGEEVRGLFNIVRNIDGKHGVVHSFR